MPPYLPDDYMLRARAAPVFIVLAPLLISVAVWSPGVLTVATGSVAAFVWLGLCALVGQLGRDFGKTKERELWQAWGGAPAVRTLRHRHSTFTASSLGRYHAKLQELLPEVRLPTREDERANPRASDETYEACVQYLRAATRDATEFPMVFKENVSYGFRRNLWGMKPFGMIVAAVGIGMCALRLRSTSGADELARAVAVVGTCFNLALLACWTLWITRNFVRVPGTAYGERLVESCERLGLTQE